MKKIKNRLCGRVLAAVTIVTAFLYGATPITAFAGRYECTCEHKCTEDCINQDCELCKIDYTLCCGDEVTEPEETEEYFGIQIMGLGRLLKAGDPSLKGLQVKPVKAPDSSVYKYIYGTFQTGEAAKEALPAVRKKFPEAFVVKVKGTKVEIYK